MKFVHRLQTSRKIQALLGVGVLLIGMCAVCVSLLMCLEPNEAACCPSACEKERSEGACKKDALEGVVNEGYVSLEVEAEGSTAQGVEKEHSEHFCEKKEQDAEQLGATQNCNVSLKTATKEKEEQSDAEKMPSNARAETASQESARDQDIAQEMSVRAETEKRCNLRLDAEERPIPPLRKKKAHRTESNAKNAKLHEQTKIMHRNSTIYSDMDSFKKTADSGRPGADMKISTGSETVFNKAGLILLFAKAALKRELNLVKQVIKDLFGGKPPK
ncbi:uncharacterized protein NEMAJ01_1175 [Nematocida major]|uniref:uncharacterized protein n=1 Tax=Nematocida major TaxID=1912982 RepID=UPI0020087E22|nr:uncharacterized protein NEMAJ01_1175 [Nematocida major]KAH9386279.1 hypothetical protein NEMAJ01_1175 [Nematocida major]